MATPPAETPPGAPSPPPAASGWTPPANWSAAPPPAPARRRTLIYASIGAVVVVVVLVLSLAALGVLPWFQSNSSSQVDFDSARPVGQAAANGFPGGPWTLLAAASLAPSSTLVEPLNLSGVGGLSGLSTCTFTQVATGNLTLAAQTNVSQGAAAAWEFVFRNSQNTILLVLDNGGATTIEGTLTGGICAEIFGFLSPIPSTVIDSTTAAEAADAAGGYAFLKANSRANATLAVTDGVGLAGLGGPPPEWVVEYTTCAVRPSLTAPTSGAEFIANVSLTTGAVLSSMTVSCTGIAITPLHGPPPPPVPPGSPIASVGSSPGGHRSATSHL